MNVCRGKDCFLYVVRERPVNQTDDIYVKIGKTRHSPSVRMYSIQNGNPRELQLCLWVNGLGCREAEIHSLLEAFNVRGEWFLFPPLKFKQVVRELVQVAKHNGQEYAIMPTRNVAIMTWAEIDAELDLVESSDYDTIAKIFWKFKGRPIVESQDSRRSRVNFTNFGARVGLPRHTFYDIAMRREPRLKETA